MEFRTLGTVELVNDGEPLAALLAQPKRLVLLAYLCMAGAPVRRAALVELFWPGSDEERGRGALRQALHFLRKATAPDVLVAHGDDAIGIDGSRLGCDAAELCTPGMAAARAAALYRGEFLAGVALPDASDALDGWLAATREQLRAIAVRAVAALRQDPGNTPAAALYWARRAAALSPDDEDAARALMTLLSEAGEHAAALDVYDALKRTLSRQLDAEPEPRTRALAAALRAGPAPLQAGKARISVAVLPLARDRAADPHGGLAYLCEGLADELHAGLARRQDIRLASRGVSVGIARISRDLASLRAGLDVDWVLDGALAPLGELLEVRLRLVALSSGQAAWERRVRVRRGEMGPLELALAQGLSAAAGCEPCPLPDAQPVAPEAWDAYLRGRYHWRKRPRDSAQALESLREAVARAPGFALAQSALADIYNTLGSWEAAAMPGLDAFPRAQGAALAALCVDPRCAEAHTALAYSTMHYLWQWDTASSQFERAIALNPNYAHAHHWHSHYQAARGQVSASLASSLRALALDPLDQVINVHLAWHYWLAGEPGNAIEQAARSGRLDPDDQWVHFFTALGHGSLGDAGAAVEASRRALALCAGSPVMLAGLAWAHAIAGDAAQARRLSRELTPPGGRVGMSYERAVIAAALGEPDLALEQLDAAVQERSAWLAYAAVDPRLKVLRGNERFDAILRTVGLVDMSR